MATSISHVLPISAELKHLGAQLEAYRLSRNITQTSLAKDAGISRTTLVKLETMGSATMETMLRVLRALDLGDRLFLLVPDVLESPLDPLAGSRQRARNPTKEPAKKLIKWGDEA